MIWDYDKWNLAAAKLIGLTSLPPRAINEDCVTQYHSIVALFEEAMRKDLSSFKIGDDRLKRRVLGQTRRMSSERYCETIFFMGQIRGLTNYVKIIRDEIVTADYESNRGIRSSKTPPQADAPHYSIHVENMHNSALMQGNHDSTINQHFDMHAEEFKTFVGSLRETIEQITLKDRDRAQANADLSTVEAQISSPKPKRSIVSECMTSIRTILENAAGSLIAAGAIAAINRYFPV
jgi:hypothetical protein